MGDNPDSLRANIDLFDTSKQGHHLSWDQMTLWNVLSRSTTTAELCKQMLLARRNDGCHILITIAMKKDHVVWMSRIEHCTRTFI